MEKTLNIPVRNDIDIVEFLKNADFLDCGASKSAFKKDNLCYKLPIGYEDLNEYSFTKSCTYPTTVADFNTFINETVAYYQEDMVWSIGQIVFEIMIWQELLKLEAENYDIEGFARIYDYFIDKNGIPVIVQEYVKRPKGFEKRTWEVDFEAENCDVLDALNDRGYSLVDIRGGNMDFNQDGILKLFDFGISRNSTIYDYTPYNDYHNDDDDYED